MCAAWNRKWRLRRSSSLARPRQKWILLSNPGSGTLSRDLSQTVWQASTTDDDIHVFNEFQMSPVEATIPIIVLPLATKKHISPSAVLWEYLRPPKMRVFVTKRRWLRLSFSLHRPSTSFKARAARDVLCHACWKRKRLVFEGELRNTYGSAFFQLCLESFDLPPSPRYASKNLANGTVPRMA